MSNENREYVLGKNEGIADYMKGNTKRYGTYDLDVAVYETESFIQGYLDGWAIAFRDHQDTKRLETRYERSA